LSAGIIGYSSHIRLVWSKFPCFMMGRLQSFSTKNISESGIMQECGSPSNSIDCFSVL
jgi:hypothetical protein